ncbi:hypothetical protein H4S07_006225, partial [Coemansia furcata]
GAVSSSPRFNALVADATRLLSSATSAEALPPPQVADSSVFVSPHSALFRDLVVALQRADVLCDRQLRLLDATPSQSTSDRAQAAATHVLDVVARAFSANASAEPLSTAESARLRSDSLRADKKRISRVRARLAAVFQASAADVDAVPFVLAECPAPPAARRKEPSGKGPEMDHGALTPRGRWEVKTGRRKFTAMSLVAPPTGDDILLLPRGPRAVYSARSYESQWLLDHALRFNGVANRYYQHALDAIEACNTPIPHALRNAHLDFRWVAAYQNLRFLALVLCLFMLVRGLYAASQLPATLGNEASGVVSQVGPGVTDLQVGDHVAYLATQDAYAQYARATASRVAKLSPHLPLETAAAVLLQGLTAHALVTRAYP